MTRAWNPNATPSKTTSRMSATASARLRMPPAMKKQVKVRVPADVGRMSPKPKLRNENNNNDCEQYIIFTNGFNGNNTEIDCIDKRDIEGKCLD